MSLSTVKPSLYLAHAPKGIASLDCHVANSRRRSILFAFTFSPPLASH
ncbi:hypothetical protein [Pseudomonas sp. NPDC089734]